MRLKIGSGISQKRGMWKPAKVAWLLFFLSQYILKGVGFHKCKQLVILIGFRKPVFEFQ